MPELNTSEENWIPWTIAGRQGELLPDKDSKVDWITPWGEVVRGGTYAGGVVWFPPGSNMYIYYTPVFWRYSEAK